ncbi:unnamed protein product, partial [Allacma fusca]
ASEQHVFPPYDPKFREKLSKEMEHNQ